MKHAHMKGSEHLVTVAQKLWDTDQVLFARGLLSRDWLPRANSQNVRRTECGKAAVSRSVPVTMSRWPLEAVAKLPNL